MEKWDVYDINKNIIKDRIVIRGVDSLKDHEYNLVTVTWVFNSKGEALMQRRAAHKSYPLLYANHGGSALAGESSEESMIRELNEEIGLLVHKDDLVLLRTFNDDETIFDEYIVFKDVSINDLIIDKREVESCSWFRLHELSKLIDDGKCFDYKNNDPKGLNSFSVITKYLDKMGNETMVKKS